MKSIDEDFIALDGIDDTEITEKYGIEGIFDYSIGVDIEDKRIQEWVKICEDGVRKSKQKIDFHNHSSGNTFVVSFKFDDRIENIITKNYIEKTSYITL
jgi:hypothetical protein